MIRFGWNFTEWFWIVQKMILLHFSNYLVIGGEFGGQKKVPKEWVSGDLKLKTVTYLEKILQGDAVLRKLRILKF